MIVLRVPNRLLALRVAGTIRASVALETKFIIYVVSLDTSEDSALLYLRVIVLQEGQPYGISLTLARLKIIEECRHKVLHLPLRVGRLLQIR